MRDLPSGAWHVSSSFDAIMSVGLYFFFQATNMERLSSQKKRVGVPVYSHFMLMKILMANYDTLLANHNAAQ